MMFDVIYKGEIYRVFDMNERCYFARNAAGKLIWLNKSECEIRDICKFLYEERSECYV